jgi:hypothetical protein
LADRRIGGHALLPKPWRAACMAHEACARDGPREKRDLTLLPVDFTARQSYLSAGLALDCLEC